MCQLVALSCNIILIYYIIGSFFSASETQFIKRDIENGYIAIIEIMAAFLIVMITSIFSRYIVGGPRMLFAGMLFTVTTI